MSALLGEYRKIAADHGKYTMEGDYKSGNVAYDRLQEVFFKIAKSDNWGVLFQLYGDPDLWVQAWAAAHTLELDEVKAIEKLRQIENAEISIVSMDAEYTIKGWKAGKLHFLK